ncbi:MFS transporter [Phenylobacterium sp.]|uniref:MFS transporter n=1 Tax=Phenylobacterium sp. TaxID=1871053 RepID=UPI00286D3452|nr:MFS transporter [Phenylobacterium sp.]
MTSQASPTAAPPADPPTGFTPYLFAHGAWFLAFGVQVVLFPYLVRVVLQESEIRFGLAQMALQLPTTLFILLGGALADRVPVKSIVVVACAFAVLTFAALGTMVSAGVLTYGLIIVYALTVGTAQAFSTPARDSLLSLVAPARIGVQGAVAYASLAQFGGQILGMACAATAPLLGVGPLLLGQAGLMAVATLAAMRIAPRPAHVRPRREGGLLPGIGRDIREGFSAVLASPIIAPVMLCGVAMGVCFMGSFFVLLPLIVESYFDGQVLSPGKTEIAAALGLFSMCFWIGSMVSAVALVRIGPLRRKGLIYLSSLATGGVILLLCSLEVPFWVFCGFNFAWGLGGGVAMTLGRSFVQQHAPEAVRARVLSIFTLGLMGGGPLGALADGFLAHAFGPHIAVLFPGALMLVIVASLFAFSKVPKLSDFPTP